MNISLHFTLEELCHSDTAARQGWNNIPDEESKKWLFLLCDKLLEPIREHLGPVVISSGYRCKQLNDSVGSKDTSAHRFGCAADIKIPGHTALDAAQRISALPLPYDQVIHEFGAWVHVAIARAATPPRKMLLTIDRHGTRAGLLEIRP